MKVLATVAKKEIIISGYIAGASIICSESELKLSADFLTSINEFELSSVYQKLIDQLNAQGKSHKEVCELVGNGVEIDFSTKIDIEDIKYDLNSEGEAKVNVTGDSEKHINSLTAEIRANLEGDIEILIDNEKSKKGREASYIRIYNV